MATSNVQELVPILSGSHVSQTNPPWQHTLPIFRFDFALWDSGNLCIVILIQILSEISTDIPSSTEALGTQCNFHPIEHDLAIDIQPRDLI
jgi:hypothetical protein